MFQIGKPFGTVTTSGLNKEVVPLDSATLTDSALVVTCVQALHIQVVTLVLA